jgi:hypothetical protein
LAACSCAFAGWIHSIQTAAAQFHEKAVRAMPFRRDEWFLGIRTGHSFNRTEGEILPELLLTLLSIRESRMDCCEQARGIEWFVQKINGALVEGLLPDFRAVVPGYKNDGQPRSLQPDATLQLEAIHSRHPNVGYHTSRCG